MKDKKDKKKLSKKEIIEKVISLDCRKEKDIRRLKKSLMNLPFVKSEKDLETDRLEEFVKKIEIKYPIHLAYIMRSVVSEEDYYSGMLKTDAGDVKGTWIRTVYGITIWEVLAKTVFFMYHHFERNK